MIVLVKYIGLSKTPLISIPYTSEVLIISIGMKKIIPIKVLAKTLGF